MFQVPAWEDDVPKKSVVMKTNTKTKNSKERKNIDKKSQLNKKKLKSKGKHANNALNTKHKESSSAGKRKQNISQEHVNIQSYDTDQTDEILLNIKKRRFNETLINDDKDDILFTDQTQGMEDTCSKNSVHIKPVINKKKEMFKNILQKHANRNSINVSNSNLRQRMLERLKAAQFRYINEKLYTSSGSEAHQLFAEQPAAFLAYHTGYRQQMRKWPVDPLDVIIRIVNKMPRSYEVADMGCGAGRLAQRVKQRVHSFDLVSTAPHVRACDMARTPLPARSVHATVYCLALMGTGLTQYLLEASRVLHDGGHLLIAEVESRFEAVDAFVQDVQRLGFQLKNLDKSHQLFLFFHFTKVRDPPLKKAKLPTITLKPCLYKKR